MTKRSKIMPRVEGIEEMRRHLAVVEDDGEHLPERPKTRGDCEGVPRPCPWVGCRHNLYLDVTKCGSIKFNFPESEPGEVPPEHSCSLDLAERGGMILAQVGAVFGQDRERPRQVEEEAVAKLLRECRRRGLDEEFLAYYLSAMGRRESGSGLGEVIVSDMPGGFPRKRGNLRLRGASGVHEEGEEPEMADSRYVPSLPGILDSSTTTEQYCDAIWNLLILREKRREIDADNSKSPGKGGNA